MAQKGDVLTNPAGGRLVFKQTSSDTNGELLEVEVTYAAGSERPPGHYHPHQEETFTILEGAMTTEVAGLVRVYQAGETFVVAPGTPHRMYNAEAEPAQVNWQVRPALNTEAFFESVWTLADRGEDGLLRMAVVIQSHQSEFRLASVVQRAALALLAPIGRMLGYPSHYSRD